MLWDKWIIFRHGETCSYYVRGEYTSILSIYFRLHDTEWQREFIEQARNEDIGGYIRIKDELLYPLVNTNQKCPAHENEWSFKQVGASDILN